MAPLCKALSLTLGGLLVAAITPAPPNAQNCLSIKPELGCVCATSASISCMEISNMYSQISAVSCGCGAVRR